jgi:hypothetical protein
MLPSKQGRARVKVRPSTYGVKASSPVEQTAPRERGAFCVILLTVAASIKNIHAANIFGVEQYLGS